MAAKSNHQDSLVISQQESAAVSRASKVSKKDVGKPKGTPPNISEVTPEVEVRQHSSVRVGHAVFVK